MRRVAAAIATLLVAGAGAATLRSGTPAVRVSAAPGSREPNLVPTTAPTAARGPSTSTTTTTMVQAVDPAAAPRRLVAPVPAPAAATPIASRPAKAGSFSFEKINPDGSPVRFNPCAAVHVVTNLAAAPASAAADVAGALGRVSAATGVPFIIDGSTTELPSTRRPSEDAARYGHRWSPVLIAWATAAQTDILPGGLVVGEGTSSWITAGPGAAPDDVYVTGEVAIDATTSRALPSGFGSGITIGELLLHELGHVVGLDHSADPSQVMSATLAPMRAAAYGPGDLAGLREVGVGSGCLAPPPAG